MARSRRLNGWCEFSTLLLAQRPISCLSALPSRYHFTMANALIPADTENPNVLHALVRKRAEVSGRIEHCQLELRRLIDELNHLDGAIHIFNPHVQIGSIRPKRPIEHTSFRGEVTNVVLDTLRDADTPMTCRELAKHLLVARGLSSDETYFVLMMTKRVNACVNVKRRQGILRVAGEKDGLQAWELVR